MKNLKTIKIVLSILVMITYLAHACTPILATNFVCDENGCYPDNNEQTTVVYDEDEINNSDSSSVVLADETGTGTTKQAFTAEFYSSTNSVIKSFNTSTTTTMNVSNFKSFSMYFFNKDTLVNGRYVNGNFTLTFNNSQILKNLQAVYLCSQPVEFSVSSNYRVLNVSDTVQYKRTDGSFIISFTFSEPVSVNDTYSYTFSYSIDNNGKTNTLLSGISNIMSNLLGVFQNVYDAIINLPGLIASNLKAFFDSIVSAVNNMKSAITNAINEIRQWLDELLSGILDGLKSLFIPEEEFFSNYFNDLHDFFSEKLGILIYPFDLFINLMNRFNSLQKGECVIQIPEIKFMNHVLLQQTSYDLGKLQKDLLGNYFDVYFMITDFIIYIMLINYALHMFKEFTGGHTE